VENGADLAVLTPQGAGVVPLADYWYKQSGKTAYKTIADYLRSKGAK
jgi:hypothetical protein